MADEFLHRVLDSWTAFSAEFQALEGPGPDQAMLRRLQQLLGQIPSSVTYLNEKKGQLDSQAQVWFSVRRWQSLPGGERALRVAMLGNFQSIRRELERLIKP